MVLTTTITTATTAVATSAKPKNKVVHSNVKVLCLACGAEEEVEALIVENSVMVDVGVDAVGGVFILIMANLLVMKILVTRTALEPQARCSELHLAEALTSRKVANTMMRSKSMVRKRTMGRVGGLDPSVVATMAVVEDTEAAVEAIKLSDRPVHEITFLQRAQ